MTESSSGRAESPGVAMPFLRHVEELRKRIFRVIIAVAVGAIAAYFFADILLDLLTRPVATLVFLAPTEAFITRLKVALIAGVFLTSPFIFYQLWRFVRPALRSHEVRHFALAVLFSTLFFLGGLAFSYFVILPLGMQFLLSFETDRLHAMLSLRSYIAFAAQVLFAAGSVFQLPVVVFFLTKLGILEPEMLKKNQRIAIVAVFVLAALLTPPDVFTQLLMVVPLILLFELSVVGSVAAARGRRTRPQR